MEEHDGSVMTTLDRTAWLMEEFAPSSAGDEGGLRADAAVLRELREALRICAAGGLPCMVYDDEDDYPMEAPVVGCECMICNLARLLSGEREP